MSDQLPSRRLRLTIEIDGDFYASYAATSKTPAHPSTSSPTSNHPPRLLYGAQDTTAPESDSAGGVTIVKEPPDA